MITRFKIMMLNILSIIIGILGIVVCIYWFLNPNIITLINGNNSNFNLLVYISKFYLIMGGSTLFVIGIIGLYKNKK